MSRSWRSTCDLNVSMACGVSLMVRRLFLVLGSPRTVRLPLSMRVSVRLTLTLAVVGQAARLVSGLSFEPSPRSPSFVLAVGSSTPDASPRPSRDPRLRLVLNKYYGSPTIGENDFGLNMPSRCELEHIVLTAEGCAPSPNSLLKSGSGSIGCTKSRRMTCSMPCASSISSSVLQCIHAIHQTHDSSAGYPSFGPYYYNHRTEPIISRVIKDEQAQKALLPQLSEHRLANIIRVLDDKADKASGVLTGWTQGSWQDREIETFLTQHSD